MAPSLLDFEFATHRDGVGVRPDHRDAAPGAPRHDPLVSALDPEESYATFAVNDQLSA